MERLGLFICLLFFPVLAVSSPAYIDFKPLDQVIKTPVSTVKANSNILPIITWGGDIATIYANGGQAKTDSKSLFAKNGLDFRLVREDTFTNQVKQYLSGKTPYLRGTMGMINLAVDVLNKDPRTTPVVFYQMTWSAGGDALVVKNNIKTTSDLRGKTIAVQAYGPHVDYLVRVLKDSGLSLNDVTIKWLPDLTGTDNSPSAAFYENDIDAAFVIIPDALALTSGGNIGTGAEDSVRGAKILMSTKTANRVIADVYAVRSDYYNAHRDEINKLAQTLVAAEAELSTLVRNRASRAVEYQKNMSSAAELLLDAKEAVADVEGLYLDAEFVRVNGNARFFQDVNYPRNFNALSKEINTSLSTNRLISKSSGSVIMGDVNYRQFGGDAALNVEQPKFDNNQVSALVSRRQQQGTLGDGELFSFDVYFSANQNTFPSELYQSEFDKVVELASTYGGAIIVVEGHSDPMGYLRAKKSNSQPVVLGRIKQSAKNLSVNRAQSVRDEIINYASLKGVSIDRSQFEPIGHGISSPATGICGSDPCAPKTEQEWRSNMRVVFRLIQVEAESNVFTPL